jgi:hypothetical protein
VGRRGFPTSQRVLAFRVPMAEAVRVIVDLPENAMAVMIARAEIVLAVRIVVPVEVMKVPYVFSRPCPGPLLGGNRERKKL